MKPKFTFVAAVFTLSFNIVLPFEFYWNIPTFMCQQFNIDFAGLSKDYSILQNKHDNFRGEKLVILYDPGNFPAILQNSSSLEYFYRNGGIPQEGDLKLHLRLLEEHIDELIPDKDFSGLAIIDFESWRPIFRQNFGVLQPYKTLSVKKQKEAHPHMSDKKALAEAKKKFEEAGKTFMLESLWLSKELRPKAKWGYYAFPYCFNGRSTTTPEQCASNVDKENNQIQWLFDESNFIYPSVYITESMPVSNRIPMVRGRVKEALRVARQVYKSTKPKVFVYHRYVFTDTLNYIDEMETFNIFHEIRNVGADGIILWGSSFDLNTKEKCQHFQKYLNDTLGPVVRSLQKTYTVELESK